MKVILKQDISELGKVGDTIEVKDGYGRNFLIPRNLAIPATRGNLQAIGEVEKQNDIRVRKQLREAEKTKIDLEKMSLTAEVLVGEEEKIFGSVTAQNIVELFQKENIEVDKKSILLEEPIKSLGVYTVPVKIEKDVVANIKLWVIRKD